MTEKKKSGFLFIINPNSGNGSAPETERYIRKYCEKRKVRYSINSTKKAGDGSEIAKKGLACGFEAIVAVGGDGTVNEIGKELVGHDIALGIIPTGSGNGLARHLKIPMSKKRAIKRLLNGKKKLIDTGLIDGRRFLNVAGIGFDAQVSRAFAGSERRGWLNYLKIILRLGRNIESQSVNIKSNNEEYSTDSIMISFANSAQFGNNAKIAPKADISDGKMDLCILAPIGFGKAILFLLKILTGLVKKNKYFNTYQCTEVSISGSDGWAHVDGDPIEISKNFEVKIYPASLNIIC